MQREESERVAELEDTYDKVGQHVSTAITGMTRTTTSASRILETVQELDQQDFAEVMDSLFYGLPGVVGAALFQHVPHEEREQLEAAISTRPEVNLTEFTTFDGDSVPEQDSYIVSTFDWPAGVTALRVASMDSRLFNATTTNATTKEPVGIPTSLFTYDIGIRVFGYSRPSMLWVGFCVETLMTAALPIVQSLDAELRLLDVSERESPVLLFSTNPAWDAPPAQGSLGSLHVSRGLQFVGRDLQLEVRDSTSSDAGDLAGAGLVWIIGSATLVVTIVLFLMIVYLSELSRTKDLVATEKEAAAQATHELLSYLFHELRNPLHVLRSLSADLRSSSESESQWTTTEHQMFHKSVTQIRHLVEDLSPKGATTKGDTRFARSTPLLPMVRGLLVKHRAAVRQGCECILESSPDMRGNVWVDRKKLRCILEQSLLWAFRQATHGDVRVRLSQIPIKFERPFAALCASSTTMSRSYSGRDAGDQRRAPVASPSWRNHDAQLVSHFVPNHVSHAAVEPSTEDHFCVDMAEGARGALKREGSAYAISNLERVRRPQSRLPRSSRESVSDRSSLLLVEMECHPASGRPDAIQEIRRNLPSPDPEMWKQLSSTWTSRDLTHFCGRNNAAMTIPQCAPAPASSRAIEWDELPPELPADSIRALGGSAGLEDISTSSSGDPRFRLWMCLPMPFLPEDSTVGVAAASSSEAPGPSTGAQPECVHDGNCDDENGDKTDDDDNDGDDERCNPALRMDTEARDYPPQPKPDGNNGVAPTCAWPAESSGVDAPTQPTDVVSAGNEEQSAAAATSNVETPAPSLARSSPAGIAQRRPRRRRRRKRTVSQWSSTRRSNEPSEWNGTVVVVDDDPANLLVARRLLQKLRYHCVTLSDGVDLAPTLSRLRTQEGIEPVAVLLDIIMLHSHGADVCRKLREDGESVKLVAATGSVTESDLALYEEVGFDRVLPKPYSARDIAACLQNH